MKKSFLSVLALISTSIFAAPVGNPLNPNIIEEGFFISPASAVNFRIGYEGNFVSDSRLDKRTNETGKIDDFKQDVNSGTFILNFQNRLDVFTALGAARIRSDWRFSEDDSSKRIELESNNRFYYAVGARAILFEWGNTVLGAGGRFSRTKPTISWLLKDGAPHQTDMNSRVIYKDWQVDLGLSHRIDIFIPYIGMKYLNTCANISDISTTIAKNSANFMKMRSKDRFGMYVGTSISNSKYFLLSVEARLIDEEAITVFGELKF